MAVEMDTIEYLSDLLSTGDVKSVKAMMNEEKFERVWLERGNDLIPTVSRHLNKDSAINNPSIVRCSEKLITKCVEKGNAKECMMELLAQFESLDEVKFRILLKPVQTALLRMPDLKAPMMQCVFSVIYRYINALPLPKYCDFDEESKLLLDNDEKVQAIRDIYIILLEFYQPLVNLACEKCILDNRTNDIRLAVLQAIFQLLGNPLSAMDLEYYEKGSSSFRVLASKIIKFILRLQNDPGQFLLFVEGNELISTDEERVLINELSSKEMKFSDLSFSVFFYLVFHEKMCSFPGVYNKYYIFQNCLTSAITLLEHKETLVLRKGLLLIKAVLEQVENGTVHFSYLVSTVHKELIEALSQIAVYCDFEEYRRLALVLIKIHFFTFEPKAQFFILLKNSDLTQHPNLLGFWTTMLTQLVRDSFTNYGLKEYFNGKRLNHLLKIFCSLQKGVKTDLVDFKDQILSALNLIIFLTMRDRVNATGVWNYTDILTERFLIPLREAIDWSRAHYEQQMETLNQPDKPEEATGLLNIAVRGRKISKLTKEEKEDIVHSGLIVFDLIEHVLNRANECVGDKPQHNCIS